MTDCEKLVEFFGKKWQGHGAWTEVNTEAFYEARELAAQVAEELEEAQQLEPNIQRQVKIITGLEIANATLRARVEQLELVEELAWGLIANAWDWVYDDLDWIGAAERWRDNYPSKPAEGEK